MMIPSISPITPQILRTMNGELTQLNQTPVVKSISPQDVLELIFSIPIVTGLGYLIPFLGAYSFLALILVVFSSWRLGNTLARVYNRYQHLTK